MTRFSNDICSENSLLAQFKYFFPSTSILNAISGLEIASYFNKFIIDVCSLRELLRNLYLAGNFKNKFSTVTVVP